MLVLSMKFYYICLFYYVIIDGTAYLYIRGTEGETSGYKNDGISWIKKNKSDSVGREREDYILHKSGILCSFRSYAVSSVSKHICMCVFIYSM